MLKIRSSPSQLYSSDLDKRLFLMPGSLPMGLELTPVVVFALYGIIVCCEWAVDYRGILKFL